MQWLPLSSSSSACSGPPRCCPRVLGTNDLIIQRSIHQYDGIVDLFGRGGVVGYHGAGGGGIMNNVVVLGRQASSTSINKKNRGRRKGGRQQKQKQNQINLQKNQHSSNNSGNDNKKNKQTTTTTTTKGPRRPPLPNPSKKQLYSESHYRWQLMKNSMGLGRGFRRSGPPVWVDLMIAASLGVVSAYYIWDEPLRRFAEECRQRDGGGGGEK